MAATFIGDINTGSIHFNIIGRNTCCRNGDGVFYTDVKHVHFIQLDSNRTLTYLVRELLLYTFCRSRNRVLQVNGHIVLTLPYA